MTPVAPPPGYSLHASLPVDKRAEMIALAHRVETLKLELLALLAQITERLFLQKPFVMQGEDAENNPFGNVPIDGPGLSQKFAEYCAYFEAAEDRFSSSGGRIDPRLEKEFIQDLDKLLQAMERSRGTFQ